jgi:hypothetical protein
MRLGGEGWARVDRAVSSSAARVAPAWSICRLVRMGDEGTTATSTGMNAVTGLTSASPSDGSPGDSALVTLEP